MPEGESKAEWDLIIEPRKSGIHLNLKETFYFKDLLFLFVKRDFVTFYKQTILGPLWLFIQPALRVITFYVIFSRIAKIPTDGIPPILFYLCGLTFWEYFASSWKRTSETFNVNKEIFGKVYFPRMVAPFSVIISNGIKLLIQFLLFALLYSYYIMNGMPLLLNTTVFLLPLYVLLIALLSLGAGLIVTSLTTKYRDLKYLLDTVIQLLMYATPVIFPLSLVTGKFRYLLLANPMTGIVEALKYAFFGKGEFSLIYLGYSALFSITLLLTGIVVFNKTERNFMDTV